jgi:hypothetical protein
VIFCIPILGIICAARPTQAVSTRRLAYASVAAPTVYAFLGVLRAIVGSPVPDEVGLVCALDRGNGFGGARSLDVQTTAVTPDLGHWRVAHGLAGAAVLTYVPFHVANRLFGLIGPEAHADVMSSGRRVCRAPISNRCWSWRGSFRSGAASTWLGGGALRLLAFFVSSRSLPVSICPSSSSGT